MSTTPVQIFRRQDGTKVDAVLHTEMKPSDLIDIEKEWAPHRMAAARKHARVSGVAKIPQHYLWDWGRKSCKLRFLAYRCVGIECEGKCQGLLMVQLSGKVARLDPDIGHELVYIDYLESAPWNLAMMVDNPIFAGIGAVLMRSALQLSIEENFHGRLGLHALPQAETFYRDDWEMICCGIDPSYENLPYYEMNRDLAAKFISSSDRRSV